MYCTLYNISKTYWMLATFSYYVYILFWSVVMYVQYCNILYACISEIPQNLKMCIGVS